jgi:putative two-component system response regulator
LARSGAYWLVLLDVAMPDMNGFEVCQKIKAEMGVQGIRVYFITAKPIEQSGVRWYEYGADGYLIKPFKREELVAVIQEMGQTLATT